MIEIGIIGCGAVVHENYARTLVGRSEYRVASVTDLDSRQAESAAKLFGAEVVPLARLLEDSEAIIVTTPPSTHAALVVDCLRPGRTVLCEKPFTPTEREARALVEASRDAGSSLYVGHFRRTFPQLELARKLVSLGSIGDVTGFVASEGGRFSWHAVSSYTTTDPAGGVLWDTGSHTLDMAMFAGELDLLGDVTVAVEEVERDKAEPSHDFRSTFTLSSGSRTVKGKLHVSRREGLPNLVRVIGTRGELSFITGLDDRVRLRAAGGSVVLMAERSYTNVLECFDLEARRILLRAGDEDFAADRFIGQVAILEALSNA